MRRRSWRKLSFIAALLAGGLIFVALMNEHSGQTPEYDLLIVGGRILDGSGSPWFKGSVALKAGRIADVGRLRPASAKRVIDVAGLVVAPGFIDLHSHSDYTLLVDGGAQSKIRQGVTTEILGESESAGPVLGPLAPEFDKMLRRYGLQRDWTTLGEYFARLERQGTSVNIASYVGSGQVRHCVLGNVDRAPSAEELEKMKQLVEGAMCEGCCGPAWQRTSPSSIRTPCSTRQHSTIRTSIP